jgi:hypothetical protein
MAGDVFEIECKYRATGISVNLFILIVLSF